MNKRSDRLVGEYLRSLLPSSLGAGALDPFSYYAGLMQKQSPSEYRKGNVNLSFAPLVTANRVGRRQRMVAEESKQRGGRHPTGNLVAEQLPGIGALSGGAAGVGVGASIGRLAGRVHTGKGALIGAAVGGGASAASMMILAPILAAIRKRRTLDEQAAKETGGRIAAKYLVPGVASYDAWKRLGASRNLIEDKSAAYRAGFLKTCGARGMDAAALVDRYV